MLSAFAISVISWMVLLYHCGRNRALFSYSWVRNWPTDDL